MINLLRRIRGAWLVLRTGFGLNDSSGIVRVDRTVVKRGQLERMRRSNARPSSEIQAVMNRLAEGGPISGNGS